MVHWADCILLDWPLSNMAYCRSSVRSRWRNIDHDYTVSGLLNDLSFRSFRKRPLSKIGTIPWFRQMFLFRVVKVIYGSLAKLPFLGRPGCLFSIYGAILLTKLAKIYYLLQTEPWLKAITLWIHIIAVRLSYKKEKEKSHWIGNN